MAIRVIAGSAKGRHLKMVPGDSTRPVMDRVKEALFNIIGRDILDANFLDLFAGTGSVGIEALSRGAKKAVFVDSERKAIQTIQENLTLTKLGDRAIVRKVDAFDFLKQAPAVPYDFIYVAPPQYKNICTRVLQVFATRLDWLSDHTTLIIQIDPTEETEFASPHLEEIDRRKYGNTLLLFFVRRQIEFQDSETREQQS